MSTPNETWRPELLAGYVDGELSARDRLAVESYLAAHPEARNEIAAQKEFARSSPLWQKVTANQPSEATWDRISLNIHAALQPQTMPAPNYRASDDEPRLPIWRRATASVAVVAAMMLLAIGVVSQKPAFVFNPTASDSFAVATAADVQIVSVQGDDNVLVVGRPPVSGPIEFATFGEVIELAIDNRIEFKLNENKDKDSKSAIVIGDGKTLPTQPTPTQPVP